MKPYMPRRRCETYCRLDWVWKLDEKNMIPDLLRRYDARLVGAIDALITRIAIWEDGEFSASAVDLTRSEAQGIAAWVINDSADPFGFCGASLSGGKLMEILETIREGGNG